MLSVGFWINSMWQPSVPLLGTNQSPCMHTTACTHTHTFRVLGHCSHMRTISQLCDDYVFKNPLIPETTIYFASTSDVASQP